uniref:Uncharacterized protein n=1 Tax=Globodera rostochiensis TaxID=31243 RepID=A0A914GW72_GLORO
MGWIFAVCCFSVAFMPSLFIFRHFVAPDPLRIILFVLGAFFWLCSLLLSSIVFAIFGPRFLLVAVLSSILFQELARGLYFVLLYKAQGGLARLMAADTGRTGTASSMRLLYSSRHILAIVCGLGMGTAAALFQLANVLAAHLDDGVVGLPAAVYTNSATTSPHHHSASKWFSDNEPHWLHVSDAFFPLYYSLGGALLTLFNVVWTICAWDAFHRYFYAIGRPIGWVATGAFTLIGHCVNTTLSSFLSVSPVVVLSLQTGLLLLCFGYSYLLIKRP